MNVVNANKQLLERSNLNNKMKANIAKFSSKQQQSKSQGKVNLKLADLAIVSDEIKPTDKMPKISESNTQFLISAGLRASDVDPDIKICSPPNRKGTQDSCMMASTHTPAQPPDDTIQIVNAQLHKMLKNCDDSIDYQEMDEELNLKNKKLPEVKSSRIVRKEYIDNTKLNYEYKAKLYYNKIKDQLEAYHEESEKWRDAVAELLLIQQEDRLVPRHIPPEKRTLVRPYLKLI